MPQPDKILEKIMPTVSIRLEENLINQATLMAKAQHRSIPKQIEYWAMIGQVMEDNPDLPYSFVRQALIAKEEMQSNQLQPYIFGWDDGRKS